MTYSEQYKDPRWQKKRLEVLNRDDFQCQCCGDTESTLHVHHKLYTYGKMVWDYKDNFFVTLCDGCHENTHSDIDEINSAIHDFKLISSIDNMYLLPDIIRLIAFMTPDKATAVLKASKEIST